ncbi:DUF4817 domain-containing protein [Trichonephila clavipes]|nr:DUF4817 domain-containing protein [Trichonephila clavipes]
MITNFFIPELNNHDVQELWFPQDGATCHTARATIDLLKDTFGDRLISRFGPANWPPRSCDLTPPDYFVWGYVKHSLQLARQCMSAYSYIPRSSNPSLLPNTVEHPQFIQRPPMETCTRLFFSPDEWEISKSAGFLKPTTEF